MHNSVYEKTYPRIYVCDSIRMATKHTDRVWIIFSQSTSIPYLKIKSTTAERKMQKIFYCVNFDPNATKWRRKQLFLICGNEFLTFFALLYSIDSSWLNKCIKRLATDPIKKPMFICIIKHSWIIDCLLPMEVMFENSSKCLKQQIEYIKFSTMFIWYVYISCHHVTKYYLLYCWVISD